MTISPVCSEGSTFIVDKVYSVSGGVDTSTGELVTPPGPEWVETGGIVPSDPIMWVLCVSSVDGSERFHFQMMNIKENYLE